MSCYFRHLKDIFAEAGVEPNAQNRKTLDGIIHRVVGVKYKNCPATWRAVKKFREDQGLRERLVSALTEKRGDMPG